MNLPAAPLSASIAASASSDSDAVRYGREALDQWFGYPWYDAATDGVRRIEVQPPPAPRSGSSWFDNWDWSWLPFANGLQWPTSLLGWLAWIAFLSLWALLIYLLYRAYRRWAAQWDEPAASTAPIDDDRTDRVERLPFPVQQPRGSLRDAAAGAYQRGDYATAIVYLFSYQLVELDKHHLIQVTKGKTNRQYLREIGSREALRPFVEQTMVAFEDVFFGNHPIDRERFDRCWARLDRFEALLAEGNP